IFVTAGFELDPGVPPGTGGVHTLAGTSQHLRITVEPDESAPSGKMPQNSESMSGSAEGPVAQDDVSTGQTPEDLADHDRFVVLRHCSPFSWVRGRDSIISPSTPTSSGGSG